MTEIVVLGSGVAGLSAAFHLGKSGRSVRVFEKDADWGGLCGGFTLDGFRFDRFVHFTFAQDSYARQMFAASGPLWEHAPVSSNYYRGCWVYHPAQNNLYPLPTEEKVKIIADFVRRRKIPREQISDYETWLRVQYGDYFAERFPFAYTRKYWGAEPHELEVKWVGNRMHSPSLEEVLRGAFEKPEGNFYYTSVMRYPKQGGFRSILNGLRAGCDITLNKKAVRIDPAGKKVFFQDGSSVEYGVLVSSLPLPEIINILPDVPPAVSAAARALRHTCGYQVSLGFRRPDVARRLWFYVYDEDIPPARVYSPNLKSPDNAPAGCSSLQAEVFYDCRASVPPASEVLRNTVQKLMAMGLFKEEDILVRDIRFEPYANITFVPDIYRNRQTVLDYLHGLSVESIGRFGKWEYMWTHQAFEDGKNTAQRIINE